MPNRIIKESAFDSDKISSLTDFEFRLWVGLITQVDDAGRGDARPAIIKGHVFPLRERVTVKDISAGIHGLAAKGCVSLYTVGGKPYFWFPTWTKHQRIRDCKPKFPDPEENDAENQFGGILPQSAAACGELPQVAALIQSNTIQSEYNPNPNPNTKGESVGEADPPTDAFSAFQEIYNGICTNLPGCKIVTDKRKRAIKAFLKQFSRDQFETICKKANQSVFCCGENDRGWKADFDFLIRTDKAANVLEGKYDGKQGHGFAYNDQCSEEDSL